MNIYFCSLLTKQNTHHKMIKITIIYKAPPIYILTPLYIIYNIYKYVISCTSFNSTLIKQIQKTNNLQEYYKKYQNIQSEKQTLVPQAKLDIRLTLVGSVARPASDTSIPAKLMPSGPDNRSSIELTYIRIYRVFTVRVFRIFYTYSPHKQSTT